MPQVSEACRVHKKLLGLSPPWPPPVLQELVLLRALCAQKGWQAAPRAAVRTCRCATAQPRHLADSRWPLQVGPSK